MNKDLFKQIYIYSLIFVLTIAGYISARANGEPALPEGRNIGIGIDSEGLYLSLPGIQDATYDIEVKNNISTNQWQWIDGVEAVDGLNLYRPPTVSEPTRFFRVLFPQPTLSAGEPAFLSASGEETVYISGQFYYAGDLIRVGGVLLSNVTFLSSTMLSGTLPAQPPGLYDVEVISGQSGEVLAVLHNAVEVAPSLERTLQEPPEWPPAGPAPSVSRKGYDYYKASSDNAAASAWYPDCDGDDVYTTAAQVAANGHVTVLKNYLDDDDDGDSIPTRSVGAGAIAGIAIGVIILDHDTDDDGYGDMALRLHSGEIQQQVSDLTVPGRGLDFAWVRTYRSRTGEDSPQGTRWSHSYDVRCVQENGAVHVYDGTGRKDTFRPQADGTYTCPGFFREGTLADDTLRLTFADTGFWEFNPFGSSPAAGKLARIQDRNGNAVTCGYDGSGRLIHVVDTLGGTNTVAYNTDDRVASVTDSTGRTVTYAYYAGETGGSTGDLKSVTSPIVTGTPNENDFPQGKTVSYTYSTLVFDEYEAHRETTVVNASGLTAVTCEYDFDSASTSFGRCVSLQRGTEAPTRITYLPQTPVPGNRFASLRCIVNDPEGNVLEYDFDVRNRCVALRELTGRAVVGQPVTDTENRPVGKLRSTDPDSYETLRSWNNDSLCTTLTRPSGLTRRCVYSGDADPDIHARKRPDLLTLEWDAKATGGADINGDGSQDLVKITTRYSYDPRFSSDPSRRGWNGELCDGRDNDCDGIVDEDCDGADDGNGFVTSITDLRGTVTAAEYDERGNLTRTAVNIEDGPVVDYVYNTYGQRVVITNSIDANGVRRVDTIEWGTCPEVVVCDASGLALTTTLERDERGNVTRCIDPNGNDTLFTYNSLDQLLTSSSCPYGEKGGQRVTTTLFYDANNNVVQVDTDNRRDTGSLALDNPQWSTRYEYDALDRCVAVAREVSPTSSITNRYEYDANGQLTARLSPLAVSGAEPQNRTAYLYDERSLPYRTIAAPGSPMAATNEWAYTPDGSLATVKYADDSVSTCIYDGFDRKKSSTDALGNTTEWFFDAAGDLQLCRVTGLGGGSGNPLRRLSESSWIYDGLGRCTFQIDSFFDVFTELSIGDGARTTQTVYAPSGQRTSIIDDFGITNTFVYDTADRLASVSDAREVRACVRDANGNVTRVTTTSVSDLGGNPQQYSCDTTYDALDRCITAVDNSGNTNRWFYDSRDLLSRTTDPRGNEIRYLYDGLSRNGGDISYVGPCDASPDGSDRGITINSSHVEYDANSRVTTVTDVNTNSTTHTYDLRNRVASTTDPAGRTHLFVWNSSGKLASEQDANGTGVTYTYDPLQRLVRKDIVPGAGVATNTTFEAFAYDGLSRCVAASNNLSVSTYTYDSLGNQTRMVQDGAPVLFTKNIRGKTVSVTYPSGVVASYTYDLWQQVKTVSLSGNGVPSVQLAAYDYDAPGRLARTTHGDGTTTDIIWNGLVSSPNPAGDYGWQGVAAISHGGAGGGSLIDERIYNYDRNQNKTLRAQTHAFDPATGSAITNIWSHDALSQTYLMRKLSAASNITRTYVLDGKGNRIVVTNDTMPEFYTRSTTIPPADFKLDQYTTTPYGSSAYDSVGNLVENIGPVSSRVYTYDYDKRVIAVGAPRGDGTIVPIASFGYDAFGRRITKTVYASGVAPTTTRYLCDGMDNDCDGAVDDDQIMATYQDGVPVDIRIFYGASDDSCGRMFASPIAILRASGETLLTRCDELGNVLALTDLKGAVVERYAYGDFGEPQFLAADGSPLTDAVGTPVTSSPAGCPYLFHGMQWDSETGLYYRRRGDVILGDISCSSGMSSKSRNQARYFEPKTGQYLSRNVRGHVELRSVQLDGSRAFENNNPWTLSGKGHGCPAQTPVLCSDYHLRKRPGRTRYQDGTDLRVRKRPGRRTQGGGKDHNSSRSNKTSSNVAAPRGGGGGGGDGMSPRAQDHNGSRSNTTESTITFGGGGGGGGGNDLFIRKRPGRVKYGNITLSRASGNGSLYGSGLRIAAKNDVRFKAGADLSKKVN